jgi:hypothetical protein
MININITIDPQWGDIDDQLTKHMKALGFVKAPAVGIVPLTQPENFVSPAPKNLDLKTTCPTSQTVVEIHTTGSTELNAEPPEDFKVDVAPLEDPHVPKPRKPRAKKSDPVVTKEEAVAFAKAAIDPQDLEDEKAHAETSVKLTHDDLRAVVGEFTKVFGIAKAQKMIPVILSCAIVEVPEDGIQDAIDKIRAEITDVEDELETDDAAVASETDVREALMAYAKKYDGDDAKMTNTLADGPKILVAEFGEGVTAIRLIPNDPKFYGRALNAINNAINNNPFKREIAL